MDEFVVGTVVIPPCLTIIYLHTYEGKHGLERGRDRRGAIELLGATPA
jgi:hypothetical protein